jgi:uncharacterized protein YdeI (YjbR/CyaY-like superfamily)
VPHTDPRIDAYIARSAQFAQPILRHLRAVVHAACPEVRESIKWGMPAFDYRGPMCSMAAFKQHATFGLWKASLILAKAVGESRTGMGQIGRITSVRDLPAKRLITGFVKRAMALNEQGVRVPRVPRPKPALRTPAELTAAFGRNPKARATFAAFSPACRRDYVDWVAEAKQPATRVRRAEQAVAWMAEGKKRNWKYEKC